MIFATTFTLLAAVWATFVTSTVLQSAAVETDQLWAFDRLIYTAAGGEEKILILCVLSASAALALVTGVFIDPRTPARAPDGRGARLPDRDQDAAGRR